MNFKKVLSWLIILSILPSLAFADNGSVRPGDAATLANERGSVVYGLTAQSGGTAKAIKVSSDGTVQTSAGGGGGAVTIANGADVVSGDTSDALVAAGGSGTISAKLRRATQGLEDLKSLIVLATGTNSIGQVTCNAGTGTFATSVASLPLPSGAATSAKQPALGVAGTASADVISVQGIASGTALGVSAASLPLPSGASTSAKQPALGVAGTASTDVITVQGIASGVAQPISAASLPLPSGAALEAGNLATLAGGITSAKYQENVAQINGVTPLMGNGVSGTGAQRVTLASDSTGQVALAAGSATIGALTANQSVNLAQVGGSAIALGVGASGTSGIPIAAPFVETTATGTTVANLSNMPLDQAGYAGLSIQVAGISASTVLFEGSNNNSTYAAIVCESIGVTASSGVSSTTGNGNWYCPRTMRYFRARLSVAGGETVTATIEQFTNSGPLHSLGVVAGQSGTWTVQPGNTANTTAWLVEGGVAAGSTDSGKPMKIGGVGRTTNPTAVTSGQRVDAIYDKLGKQVVVGSIRDLKGDQHTAITSSTSETTIVTAVASTFLDIYSIRITNSSATAALVTIRDDTAGTIRDRIYIPAGDTRGWIVNESAGLPQAVVNKPWTAQSSASVDSLYITVQYVKNT